MAHEFFNAAWIAYSSIPHMDIGGMVPARTRLEIGIGESYYCYAGDYYTVENTPVDKSVAYLEQRIATEMYIHASQDSPLLDDEDIDEDEDEHYSYDDEAFDHEESYAERRMELYDMYKREH